MKPLSESIGMRERWIECVKWRLFSVLLLMPLLGVAVLVLLTWARPSSADLLSAAAAGCVLALVIGATDWADSPAQLRRRLRHFVFG